MTLAATNSSYPVQEVAGAQQQTKGLEIEIQTMEEKICKLHIERVRPSAHRFIFALIAQSFRLLPALCCQTWGLSLSPFVPTQTHKDAQPTDRHSKRPRDNQTLLSHTHVCARVACSESEYTDAGERRGEHCQRQG